MEIKQEKRAFCMEIKQLELCTFCMKIKQLEK